MKVTNIDVRDIKYDLTKWKPYETKLKELLPTKKREIVSFILRNTDTPTANGLRRTLIEELPVKILHTTVGDIETDEEFLIRDELIDRIHSVPIEQSVKTDATFSIDFLNTDTTTRIGHLYSGDIKRHGSAKDLSNLMDSKFRIAELHPGKHLRVNNITILTGYGYMHANFMMVCGIAYKPLDFIDVTLVNERGFFVRGMANTETVLGDVKGKFDEVSIHKEKILYMPAGHKEHMSTANLERIASYTQVVNKNVEFKSCSVSHPSVYMLEVETLGTMPARELISTACENLIGRFQKIYDGLETYLKNPNGSATDPDVVADITQTLTRISLKGESHTVGEILVYNVQKLDSGVSNVSKNIIHPMIRTVVIQIVHAEPIRIIMDACKLAIKNYDSISHFF